MYQIHEPAQLLSFLMTSTHKKRNDCKNLLKYGHVRVNGEKMTQAGYQLMPGDIVEIGEKPKNTMSLPIIFEDDDLIVIDKPSGLLSFEMQTHEKTAFQIVKDYVSKKHEDIYLVHRLDQQTSGLLMFVKKKKLAAQLTRSWNDYVTLRGYKAIVEGKMTSVSGTIDKPLMESRGQVVFVAKNGKRAVTHYQVIQEKKGYTLLDIQLETGRKNQIRAHMSHLHHPVAGDGKYGAKTNPIKRLALHADAFAFRHPVTKQEMRFTSPLPEEMTKFMSGSKKRHL